MKIIADLHTHTRYSHGKGSVLDNVSMGLSLGLKAIGITDHGPRSAPWIGASAKDFMIMREEVVEVDRRAIGIKVLAGAECNIISAKGDLDVPESIRGSLDLILAGLHPGILPLSGRDWWVLTGANWAARLSPNLRRRARVRNTEAVVAAVYRNEIDVITHPGYHLEIDTVELARACADRNTAMEINARHDEMTIAFCRLAAREGVRFVINSDAHVPEDVGNLNRGTAVARAAGLDPERVLNSDRGGLFDWLAEKQSRRHVKDRTTWSDWSEQRPLDRVPGKRQDRGRQREGHTSWTDWSDQGKVH
jgi:putative hydrolase